MNLLFQVSSTDVRPEFGELVRYSDNDLYSYATLIQLLSSPLAKAQLYYQEGITSKPFKLTIVADEKGLNKYKSADYNTPIDRLKWLMANMAVPSGGIHMSLYSAPITSQLDSPYCFNTLWHTKTKWAGCDSNYITLQAHSERDHNEGKSPHRVNIQESVQAIRTTAQELGYQVVEVDYTTDIDELSKVMLGAKAHFSYIGSTGYVAALLRVPTVHFGRKVHKHTVAVPHNIHPWYKPGIGSMSINRNVWNSVGTPEGRTLMYNDVHSSMYHNEPEYYTMACDLSDVVLETKRILL